MVSTPKPPAAPDPVTTASAQGAANTSTAIANQTLNMVDQYTPQGSLIYKQIGTSKIPNGLGGYVDVPRYSATQTLSPEQKALYGLNSATEKNIAQIGLDQSKRIGDLLSTPVDLSNKAVEARLYDLGSRRLDPRFASEEEALRTRLINSGIQPGSAAFEAEMRGLSESKNDAYNQLLLTGRGQAVQEALAERSTPINEISALLTGSQISQPNFVNTPGSQIAGVDYQGAVQNKYNAEMNAYNQQVAGNNAMMGGLFGLAAAPFGMFKFTSDRRLKRDIVPIGVGSKDLTLYSFKYLWDEVPRTGYMADEVEKVMPEAVSYGDDGFAAVDYAMVEGF